MSEETLVALGEDFPELRDSVRKICARYPGTYWSGLEDKEAYPTEFVERTDRGRLPRRADPRGIRRLRPAAARRGGDPGGNQRLRLRRQPGPRADVHHGHAAAARQRGAEAKIPAGDRRRPHPPAGVRRHRTDHRVGHHAVEDPGGAGRRFVRDHRPESVDLARAALRHDAAAGAHHLRRSGEEAQRRAVGVPDRHDREEHRQGPGGPADQGDDQPQHDGSLLRQFPHSRRQPDRRGRARGSATSWTA